MSVASERARALLGGATPGWRRVASVAPLLFDDGRPEHAGPYSESPAAHIFEPTTADLALIAAACSPEGGLLQALAGEVEAAEQERTAYIEMNSRLRAECERLADRLLSEEHMSFRSAARETGREAFRLEADNARLRAALEDCRAVVADTKPRGPGYSTIVLGERLEPIIAAALRGIGEGEGEERRACTRCEGMFTEHEMVTRSRTRAYGEAYGAFVADGGEGRIVCLSCSRALDKAGR